MQRERSSQGGSPALAESADFQGGHEAQLPLWSNIQAQNLSAYRHTIAVEQSNLKGTKYALLVGINYYNKAYSQQNNINAPYHVEEFLVKSLGFSKQHIVILSDNQASDCHPTFRNIREAFERVMRSVRPNDSVFFYFCGLGLVPRQLKDKKTPKLNELRRLKCDHILPSDFETHGAMDANYLNRKLVRRLPKGARLTAVFDCITSETGMNVPYRYKWDGTPVITNAIAGKNLFETRDRMGEIGNASYNELTRRFESDLSLREWERSADDLQSRAFDDRLTRDTGDIIIFGWHYDYDDPNHRRFTAQAPMNQLHQFFINGYKRAFNARQSVTYRDIIKYSKAGFKSWASVPFIATGRKISLDDPFIV